MSEPLIFFSTWKIKEGKLEDYKRFAGELMRFIEAKEPRMIAFNMFLSEDQSEMTSIQVHPDADSMDYHLQVLKQVIGQDMVGWVGRSDFLEPGRFEIYGAPSEALLEANRTFVEAGMPQSIKPIHLAGFSRSTIGT